MGYLKEKSVFNLTAAELLFQKQLFAPSVHCAYYSVFQLMKHIVKVFSGINYVDQETEIINLKQQKATQNIGVHEYIIMKIGIELKKNDITIYGKLNRQIKDLRKFRIESDYQNKQVTFSEGDIALGYSKELNKELKQIFNV